ncbi:MAG: FAD-dependent oxidoreductase, partial [Planctomycetota bacterium]
IIDAERIRAELHDVVWGVWDYIKNVAPERAEASHWELEWIGALPGKRENRRFTGQHVLSQNDVRAGGRFDDIVAYGGWSMDDHPPAGLLYPGKPTVFHAAPSPYGIPLRSLISRNVRNLLFAGRNISATHAALSSTRVMATCALLGQAAGTAAALARRHGCEPSTLYPQHVPELQQLLMQDDVWLPGHARNVDALARRAHCDAPELLSGHDRPQGDDEQVCCRAFGEALRFEWDAPVQIDGLRLVCDSNLQDRKKMPCSYPASLKLPDSLLRDARVEIGSGDGQWECVQRISDNAERLLTIPIRREARALRIVPESTWGGGSEVRLFAAEPMHQLPERYLPRPQRRDWAARRAAVDPGDLAPPANEGDGRRRIASA